MIHAKISPDGSRFALWVVQCDSAPDAVAAPIRMPLSGLFTCSTVMDSDDSRWARARVEGPAVDDMGPISGEWIAAQGLPVRVYW